MKQLVFAAFAGSAKANEVIEKLQIQGYDPKDMSVITQDRQTAQDMGANVVAGAASGATTGGIVGALAGL